MTSSKAESQADKCALFIVPTPHAATAAAMTPRFLVFQTIWTQLWVLVLNF